MCVTFVSIKINQNVLDWDHRFSKKKALFLKFGLKHEAAGPMSTHFVSHMPLLMMWGHVASVFPPVLNDVAPVGWSSNVGHAPRRIPRHWAPRHPNENLGICGKNKLFVVWNFPMLECNMETFIETHGMLLFKSSLEMCDWLLSFTLSLAVKLDFLQFFGGVSVSIPTKKPCERTVAWRPILDSERS